MVDRNTTLQNKDDIKDSNSISISFTNFLNFPNSNLNNRIKFIISATIDNNIQICNYWTLNDFPITIYFYIIVDNNIFSFLFLYVLCLKFKNYNLSYKLIQYIL